MEETDFMKEIKQQYADHLQAIGLVATSWNRLQETLGDLFSIVLRGAADPFHSLFGIPCKMTARSGDSCEPQLTQGL
jgi:hypothetical protein